MPGIEFSRFDFSIVIAKRELVWAATFSWPDSRAGLVLAINDSVKARLIESRVPLDALLEIANATELLERWLRLPEIYDDKVVSRVVLDLPDIEWARLPWENSPLLQPSAKISQRRVVLVRSVNVIPRFHFLPMTFPLRIVQVDRHADWSVRDLIRQVFDWRPEAKLAHALVMRDATADKLMKVLRRPGFVTAEVIHFSQFSGLSNLKSLLSTATPGDVQTVGGLSRVADLWNTRLIVIECQDEAQFTRGRMLGHALCNRGGPAVLIAHNWNESTFREFYWNLVHDFPIDQILMTLNERRLYAIFAGAGREEALRVSSVPLKLIDEPDPAPSSNPQSFLELKRIANRLRPIQMIAALPASSAAPTESGGSGAGAQTGKAAQPPFRVIAQPTFNSANLKQAIRSLSKNFHDRYKFNLHESQGFLPVADEIHALRKLLNVKRPVLLNEATRPRKGPRFVNIWPMSSNSDGGLVPLDSRKQRMKLGLTYQLCVQIGPKDVTLRVVGRSAVVEEVFKMAPTDGGVWVELGVTGLDFEALGDAVRDVFLPHRGVTDPAVFAVRPRRKGVSCLRVCLYHCHNVVQSFKLAVLVGGEGKPSAKDSATLANALGVARKRTKNVTYLSRLEYSQTQKPVDDAGNCPPRRLSLVCNDFRETAVFTLKGDDCFQVHTTNDLKDFVDNARVSMVKAASLCEPTGRPAEWRYLFVSLAKGVDRNTGTPELYTRAMIGMASAGYDLFISIFGKDREERRRLQEVISGVDQVIHIANTLAEKSVPWPIIYDRYFDDGDYDQNPKDYEACTVPLEATDGDYSKVRCGEHERCPLNPKNIEHREAAGVAVPPPERVACPLGFWGFRHQIEVPPRQSDGKELPPGSVDIAAAPIPRIFVGYHSGLTSAADHVKELRASMDGPPKRAVIGPECSKRNEILRLLKADDLDLIYLFCHAEGGNFVQPKVVPPRLALSDGVIKAAHLTNLVAQWSRHPLVILNACNTAGFSNDALSPFIQTLVDDCGASGVLGTEVPVFELFAGEFAIIFLNRLLNGETAGQSLLNARREMLKKRNPLGMIYTLYASADLSINRIKLQADNQSQRKGDKNRRHIRLDLRVQSGKVVLSKLKGNSETRPAEINVL